MTPRFRTSSHVVFLILPQGQSKPVLVAKVPRLAGAGASVTREVANLRAVQASRPGGFDSIPRVIAFEEYAGHQLLVETALVGQLMDPALVQHDMVGCCQAVTRWLVDVQQASRLATDGDWFERLIARPLRHFETVFPLTTDEGKWLAKTWEWAESLRQTSVPLMVEHGDLSHPNIFLFDDGRAGVVDWELAEPSGLPAYDLYFFLTYVAIARNRARTTRDYLTAFHHAFFGPEAWARPYITAYARELHVPSAALTPLFVLSWARYMANLLLRLDENGLEASPQPLAPETADWLRQNRYYALWQHTLTNLDELHWLADSPANGRSN